MPRRCTVCNHHERHGIDEALVTGAPYRSVAKRFGLDAGATGIICEPHSGERRFRNTPEPIRPLFSAA